MSKENNKKINILKSKLFIRLFSIPSCIWILLTLSYTIDQSDSKSLTLSEFIISNLIVLGIWFIISFLIAKYPKKKWEEKSTFEKIRFPLIMSIITFLIGILLSCNLIGFSLKAQLIVFLVAFLPFILFAIFVFAIYKNKEKQKVFIIFKIISIVITCLLLFYYIIAMFVILITEGTNPMTNPKYYIFHVPDSKVFPKKIPKDVEDVKFFYAPGVFQGGTRYTLYYIDKNMTLNEFDKKYKKQSKWTGHIDYYKEKVGLLNEAFYYTPSKDKNENDYVIYLIRGRCDNSGYCNHGDFLIVAFNEKTHQVIYSTETW